MKKLDDSILLYDAACPMCEVYSHGFIAAGMLDKSGRMDYAGMSEEIKTLVDVNRARNEIALVNLKNQTVKYGIFSLFAIISHSFPAFNILFDWKPFQKIMKRVYSFVSFNRRVIICGNEPENPLACNPDFSLKYRIAYLIFAAVLSAFILKTFTPLLGNYWPIPKGWIPELLLVSGQLVFQYFVLRLFSNVRTVPKLFDYFGNLMMISLMGSLLLVPAIILNRFVAMPVYVMLFWFATVVLCMFLEHKRRIKIYQLPAGLTYSWVIYRILVSSVFFLIALK